MAARKKIRMNWYRMDLHIHTPASADFQDPSASYLDVLRKAEFRGLDITAFTDHNSVAGYAAMMEEIERLAYLERLGRALPDELRTLAEYRRLLDKILVLPGFEFTATFGFHILGIFSPDAHVRQLEYLLLHLNVPPSALDAGNSEVGASSDVLTAYRVITDAGGICIAAHVNSAHGVAMRGLDFGGQTRIAYTQDRNLHALEVTDLGRGGRNSTERFFNGTKPEYPRRMRCIQGSDAHRINALTDRSGKVTQFGVGDRVTEVLLPERSFEALREVFLGNDYSRTRPYSSSRQPMDYIQAAREEGPSLVQAFHDSMSQKGGKLYAIITDVCAFANTNGGTIYVGLSADKKQPPVGISNPQEAVGVLQREISRLLTPALDVEVDVQETQGKPVIRIQVPSGEDRPYAIEDNKIYVRDEEETSLAVRDEIVNLVRQRLVAAMPEATAEPDMLASSMPRPLDTGLQAPVPTSPLPASDMEATPVMQEDTSDKTPPPRAGVEIIGAQTRDDTIYYIMRDLRNGNIVKNVTRSSARRLWHYAIKQRESNPVKPDRIQWHGDIGLWARYEKMGETRYDLAQRDDGGLRVYYGVTENGMHGPWQIFLAPEDEE